MCSQEFIYGISLARGGDDNTDCARNGEAAACGVYFPVTDHIGKPVLMLDGERRVTGTGEYDAYGNVNRLVRHGASANPYSVGLTTIDTVELAKQENEVLQVRADFHGLELSPVLSCDPDRAGIYTAGGAALSTLTTIPSGGRSRTGWVTSTGAPLTVRLFGCRAYMTGGFPGYCTCATTGTPTIYKGAMLEAYEYRRRETGTSAWLFTPLRFPGQYHDAETDLYENWNRYYDPSIGRYLQPEPLLQSPRYVRAKRSMVLSANRGTPSWTATGAPFLGSDDDAVRRACDPRSVHSSSWVLSRSGRGRGLDRHPRSNRDERVAQLTPLQFRPVPTGRRSLGIRDEGQVGYVDRTGQRTRPPHTAS